MKKSVSKWISAGVISALSLGAVFLFFSNRWKVLKGGWSDSGLDQVFSRPILHLGSLPVTLAFLVKMTLFLTLLGIVAGLARGVLQNRLLTHASLDSGQRYAYSRIGSYVIYLIGLVIGLQTAGVNLNSLLVVGGAVGIGVGLGLQTLTNNFVSGLALLFERPIKIGDRVEVGGVLGDVVRMASRSTWVRTNENVVIIVPNSEFITSRVTNWTANDRSVRFSMPIGVGYGSSPSQVREILMGTAQSHPDVLQNPSPDVLFVGFGDSSLNFELRVWTVRQVQTPKSLMSDLYFAVFENFGKAGIEIPFPQRDVHVKSIPLPTGAPTSTSGH